MSNEHNEHWQCICHAGSEEIDLRVNRDRWRQFKDAVTAWQDVNQRIEELGVVAAMNAMHESGLTLLSVEEEMQGELADAAERLVESVKTEAEVAP